MSEPSTEEQKTISYFPAWFGILFVVLAVGGYSFTGFLILDNYSAFGKPILLKKKVSSSPNTSSNGHQEEVRRLKKRLEQCKKERGVLTESVAQHRSDLE